MSANVEATVSASEGHANATSIEPHAKATGHANATSVKPLAKATGHANATSIEPHAKATGHANTTRVEPYAKATGHAKATEDIEKKLLEHSRCDAVNKMPLNVAEGLCKDYAAYARVNISHQQIQIMNRIAIMEGQLTEFNQLMEMVGSDSSVIAAKAMPAIKMQYQALQPTFENLDRLEALVSRVQKDMDEIEKQLDAAESTVNSGPLQSVLKIPFIFSRQNGMGGSRSSTSSSLSDQDGNFQPVSIFKTEDYF